MKRKLSYILAILVTVAGLGCFASSQISDNKFSAVPTAPPAQTKPVTETPAEAKPAAAVNNTVTPVKIRLVNPLMVVKAPTMFLNKRINCIVRFDKFATLGLDYKPAFRSSENYISFLIFRPDTDKNIPLPEMKLFLPRKSAEKFIDLKENDKVQFSGIVFSNALGDVWVDVDTLAKVK